MRKACIILMNGFTASLKTTVARRLSAILKIPLIQTNQLGRITDKKGLMIAKKEI